MKRRIAERIALGESKKDAAAAEAVPYPTLMRWVADDLDFRIELRLAREKVRLGRERLERSYHDTPDAPSIESPDAIPGRFVSRS